MTIMEQLNHGSNWDSVDSPFDIDSNRKCYSLRYDDERYYCGHRIFLTKNGYEYLINQFSLAFNCTILNVEVYVDGCEEIDEFILLTNENIIHLTRHNCLTYQEYYTHDKGYEDYYNHYLEDNDIQKEQLAEGGE